MDHKINRIAYTGNMDKDSDVRYVGKGNNAGDGLDARNIQAVDAQGNVQGSIPPTLGNEFAFDIGQVSQQNKRYRITFDGDVTKQHELKFFSTQRDALMVVGSGPNGELQFNGTQLDFINAFNSAISGSGTSWLLSAPTATTVEIELASYPMYQWYLDSVGTDLVSFTCIAEAIPVDLAGPLKDIGSYDLLGDLFIFSTTQDDEPTAITPTIILVGPTSGGTYVGPLTSILFNGDHGLVQGQWIRITGSNESFLNGLFVVHSVIDAQTVRIVTSTAWGVTPPVTTLGTPQVFINPSGIGEIGVAQKNENTDAWTYTRLLRSVELNFVSRYMIVIEARIKNERKIVYFTDNYNRVRYVSHGGAYVTDGLLNYVNSSNTLQYDSIQFQTALLERLFSEFVSLTLHTQLDSGGQLTAGNKYYSYRFLDQFDNPTKWADLTGAIPVYARTPNLHDPITIKGNEPGFVTSKANVLSLSGIPIGIFRSVEFAVVEPAQDGSASAIVFSRSIIPPQSSEIKITHSGFENDTTILDVGELIVDATNTGIILKAKAISIIDKRLVLANLTYARLIDLERFSNSFRHSLRYKSSSGTGNIVGSFGTSKVFGGSISPQNVLNSPSMVLLETYRVGADYEFIDGSVSSTFWIDDIKIDTSLVNPANPSDNRRIAGLPDYILNDDSFPYDQRIPEIVFENIDPDFLIDGIPVKQVITKVRFRFARIVKEVLASGYVVMGVSGNMTFSPLGPSTIGIVQQTNAGSTNGVIPYPNFLDRWTINGTSVNPMLNELTATAGEPYPMSFTPERQFCSFFSPEISMGALDGIQLTAADSINVFYPMLGPSRTEIHDNFISPRINSIGASVTNGGTGTRGYGSARAQYIVHPETTAAGLEQQNSVLYNNIPIDDLLIVDPGSENIVGGSNFHNYLVERSIGSWTIPFNQTGSSRFKLANAKCAAIKTTSNIFPADAVPSSGSANYWNAQGVDKGVYYAQIFRSIPNKYGDKDSTIYDSCSSQHDMALVLDTSSQLAVTGGDAFLTTVYVRHRFNDINEAATLTAGSWSGITSGNETGRHLGIFYTCQSYMNMDLVYTDPLSVSPSFPEDYTGTYFNRMSRWVEDLQGEYIQYYNPAYSYIKNIVQYSAYFEDSRISKRLIARIAYSLNDIYSSVDDSMLIFLPLNIHDLDTTWGEISEIKNVNGELVSLQKRKWQRQFFNARGILESNNNSVNVLLGAGDVMSRDGETLSSYGTDHQQSVRKGTSDGGKDTLYWYNAENGLFMRFGADGTIVISNRNNFRSYANKAAKWLRGKDTPAFDQGIRCVWDDRSKEVIWTFTGWRTNPQWTASPTFPIVTTPVGFVVVNANAPSDTYENLPRFFVCKQSHTASAQNEPGVGPVWEDFWTQIAYDDFDHYSVFTVAFNEATNGFKTFYGHIPKTYLKWQDTFLSSHPVHRNLIFEHRRGEPTTWYGRTAAGIAPKIEDAHVEMVVNELPEQTTRGIAVRFLSKFIPQRVDYRTERHHTWDEAAEFKKDGDQWTAPIRKDATVTGTPVKGGDILTGEYLRVKFTIFGGTYNLLHSIVVKYLDKARRINR